MVRCVPGAFTAQTLMPPRSLLTMRVDRASDSTSCRQRHEVTISAVKLVAHVLDVVISTRSIK